MKILLLLGFLLHVSQHARARVVEAIEGTESVLLPCSYSGQIPDEPLVKWTCSDFIPTTVHLRRGEEDDLRDQNQHFRGRTSIKADALDTRDFSLTLKKPQMSDRGYYTCSISDGREELILTRIYLKIKDDQEEVKLTEGAESVVLPCRTLPNLHEKTSVDWTRSEPEFNTVHVFSNTSKYQNTQDTIYCRRTKMNEDLLRTGDLSLTLSYPTDRDSGTYICTVYRDDDILRWKVVLKPARELVEETFPSWATALLFLLVLFIVSAGLLYYFRHYFMSEYRVQMDYDMKSVLLPCKTTTRLPEDFKVEWKDGDDRIVHLYENGSHQTDKQDELYQNRTKMDEKLKYGDFSLTLKHPTSEDINSYNCHVYNMKGHILMKKRVDLKVTSRSEGEEESKKLKHTGLAEEDRRDIRANSISTPQLPWMN